VKRHEEYMKDKMKDQPSKVLQQLEELYEMEDQPSKIIRQVDMLASLDTLKLNEAEKSYGDSWKQRGGVGAFMMLARKWDRLEKQVGECNYDVFQAAIQDSREEGILDDIRDLRRYLFLVEAEVRMRIGDKDDRQLELEVG